MNYWEPFGNIRDEKGEDEKGRRFLLCLEPPKARELHLCNQKKHIFVLEPIDLLLKDIHVVNNIPTPPFFFFLTLSSHMFPIVY
jgi:hypothetical protein